MSLLFAVLIFSPGVAGESKNYPRANLLLEPSELTKPDVAKEFRILDARPKSAYHVGHVPNAVWVDHDAWSKAFAQGQDSKRWSQLIGALGVGADMRVVIYDDQSTNRAARIWWILR